ncbi:hypothetical protein KIL84_006368 [Mauremys mutica]|uniref:Uncharacterized protein n=1 Tax=Mauremys mutica TaxID=74926 RepID=A0A9D3X1B3_9SAUR|nr:hypothetical protein KIL84_006368 [Mauremys mutica]
MEFGCAPVLWWQELTNDYSSLPGSTKLCWFPTIQNFTALFRLFETPWASPVKTRYTGSDVRHVPPGSTETAANSVLPLPPLMLIPKQQDSQRMPFPIFPPYPFQRQQDY